MEKPVFVVDISADSQSSLEAHATLSLIKGSSGFHIQNGFRLPLGIYNVSVSRASDKVKRLCGFLEGYIQASKGLDHLTDQNALMQETIDYIELALYASAEHVNDVYSIAAGFFPTKAKANKNPNYRKLDKSIKEHKKFIAAAANFVKHQQSRIRMFSMEFQQGRHEEQLHGFFFEGVENGVVCPNSTFHKDQDVFAITTLAWECIYLLLNCSRELARFLNAVVPQYYGPPYVQFPKFSEAVVAAARLPVYTFGEEHPFKRATLRIRATNDSYDELESGLYGSIKNGWSKSLEGSFGRALSKFEGDGTTTSFRYAQPKSVSLQHWD